MNDGNEHEARNACTSNADHGDAPEGRMIDIAGLARKHGISEAAVQDAADALKRGRGRQAQFDNRELGGMGQWSAGGMLMIGDMFNHGLKAKVAALFDDLSTLSPAPHEAVEAESRQRWPAELGQPSSTGSQNDMHYAVFPKARRLAVVRAGKRTIYDTADHQISGVGQQQSGDQTLGFTGPTGTISLADLAVVNEDSEITEGASHPSGKDPIPKRSSDADGITDRIGKLHDLLAKGALTQEEYDGAKRRLLDQL